MHTITLIAAIWLTLATLLAVAWSLAFRRVRAAEQLRARLAPYSGAMPTQRPTPEHVRAVVAEVVGREAA